MSDEMILCNNCITVCDECYKRLRSAREQRCNSEEMDDLKRAELEDLRSNAIQRTSLWANEKTRSDFEDSVFIYGPGFPVEGKEISVGSALNPGPKLHDALMMAGHKIIEDDGNYVLTSPPAPRRSGIVALVIGVGIFTILILSAMTAGWL